MSKLQYIQDNIMLVGLAGEAGSGKDYIANFFKEDHGFYNFSWAWPMKIELFADGVADHDDLFIHKPEHVRNIVQIAGTELGRMRYGKGVWINRVFAWLVHLHKEWGIDRVIIPDTRFTNEVMAIQHAGGWVYRVVGDVNGRELTDKTKQHSSENSLPENTKDLRFYEGIIHNYKGRSDPREYVSKIVERLESHRAQQHLERRGNE